MLLTLAICGMALWALLVPAYPLWLQVFRRGKKSRIDPPLVQYPRADILVAVRNEAKYIEAKIRNLKKLQYPVDRLRFWIVDGTSDDGTLEIAARASSDDPRFTILACPVGNKPSQLNVALRFCSGDWVLVTDADVRLRADTLLRMIRAGEAGEDTAVVGTTVEAADAYWLERLHWEMADHLRLQESDFGFASIVTGACYLFRRGLFETYATDAFGDDAFTAFAAAAAKKCVRYISASAQEMRCPIGLFNFLRHKTRKAHNYLTEIFRAMPHIPRMKTATRWIFIARALQMTVAPVLWILSTVGVIVWSARSNRWVSMFPSIGFLVGIILVVGWLGRRRIANVLLGVVMTCVLLVTFISYPFNQRRQVLQNWRLPEPAEQDRFPVGGSTE
jgi:cellulose synthase/poly-beta-1,6-N-acetylglucosamine synthase-like glycosyltransferase